MAELNLAQCTASFELEPHYDLPKRLFYVTGTASHPTIGELATLRGYIMRPRFVWKSAGDFAEVMDEESDEMMHFSTEVLDNDTNIQPWLIDGGHRSGSGCWGQELNQGDIVYLEDITVKEPFLRRGVGSWFLQQFLQSPHVDVTSHVFCWPTSGPRATESITNENVVAFYHKNDFRRIGRTSFLCYSRDPEHPSRKLAIADDATLFSKDFPAPLAAEILEAEYPLHIALASDNRSDIIDVIKNAYALDPASIHKKGPDGFAPIHIAAGRQNVNAVRTLLELGVDDDLKSATNTQGTTPLEALAETMRSDRYLLESIIGLWDGYSTDSLTCEYLLKKALNMPLVAASEDEYIVKRKYGCTCGQCTDGWLSPRMKHRLSVTGEVQHEMNIMELSYMKGRHPKEYYLMMMDTRYLPPALHPLVNKAFCRVWYEAFGAIHDVLDSPGQIPTPARVASQPAMFAFTMRGGKAEYVLDAITAIAKEQSSLGDGTFEETYEEYEDIACCANDLAFGLVRRKLGLDPRMPWGPYYTAEDVDEEMDDDSDF